MNESRVRMIEEMQNIIKIKDTSDESLNLEVDTLKQICSKYIVEELSNQPFIICGHCLDISKQFEIIALKYAKNLNLRISHESTVCNMIEMFKDKDDLK